MIKRFLTELDQEWKPHHGDVPPLTFQLFGACALLLQEPRHRRATKDADVIETAEMSAEVKGKLLTLGGRDSDLHKRHSIYLEVVSNGIPFLPQQPAWKSIWPQQFQCFNISVLSIVDVVVSKLIRFSSSDQEDIEAMIELQQAQHSAVLARLALALYYDPRTDEFSNIVENFHTVERDVFGVPETDPDTLKRLSMQTW